MGLRRSKLVSSRAADRTSTQHLNNGVEDAKVNAKCYETVARAHESFIQSVVVAAIKTLMLVRRWCRQTCRLFRHRFLISSTTDTGRLSLSLPLFLTLSLSLSLSLSIYLSIYLSISPWCLSLQLHTRASVIITVFVPVLSVWNEINHFLHLFSWISSNQSE